MNFTESQHLFAIILILSGTGGSVWAGKLTLWGASAGAFIASLLYVFGGYTVLMMLGAFFITTTTATAWKKKEKQRTGEPGHQIKRNTAQVLANAAAPAFVGILIYFYPEYSRVLHFMIAGCLASATADTLSSELGMIYGRRFYNVLSWKTEARGLDGVISLEGTVAGFAGSALIAFIFGLGYKNLQDVWVIIFAGVAGNLFDSILGASLERKGIIKNDMVNFLNTTAAALVTAAVFFIIY